MVRATCDKYKVPENARVSVLTDALEGQALDYYLDTIAGQVDTLRRAFELLEQRFDSAHSRAQAQSYLDCLSLASIRESEQCSTTQALDKAVKKISSVAPMCGPGYAHESHKSRWLSNMLRQESWAQRCCENRMTMAQDYKSFVAALHAALTQISIASGPDKKRMETQLAVPPSVYYGRQYALPVQSRRQHRYNAGYIHRRGRGRIARTPEQLRRLKQTTRCLRYGQTGHWRAECPNKHITMTDAINARLRSMGTNFNTVQEALIALVKDEDEYNSYEAHTTPDTSVGLFEQVSPASEHLIENQYLCAHNMDPRPFDAMIAQLEKEDESHDPFGLEAETANLETTPTIHLASHQPEEQHETLDLSEAGSKEIPRINIVFAQDCLEDDSRKFRGGLIDTGAQRTVIGLPQAVAYVTTSGLPPNVKMSNQRFRFGDKIVRATHSISIRIPTPSSFLTIRTDVVPVNIPFLFGLDVMRKFSLQPLVIKEELESLGQSWRLPLTFYHGHLYLRWFPSPNTTPRSIRLPATHASLPRTPSAHIRAAITYFTSTPGNQGNPMPMDRMLNPKSPTPQTPGNPMHMDRILNPTSHAPKAPPFNSRDLATSPPIESSPRRRDFLPGPRAFTTQELLRIHKHFAHASARKLYDLLCRASTSTPPNTLQQLEDIVATCGTCIEFSPRSVSFRVREADSTLFNHRLTLDLAWLPARKPPYHRANRPALHIVDIGTRFNAAIFIDGESSTAVWNSFLQAWACMYIGMPSSILVDQGSVFISDEWRHACELNQIELVPTGTGSHNSLNAGESYHAYLRRLYNKVHRDYPRLSDHLTLAIAVKAINDTTGPKGLCPTLLVFGVLPQLPSPSRRTHPTQLERFRAAAAARREYEIIVNDERLRIAARKQTPPAANRAYRPGDMVYVYRERLKRFTGPHMIASIDGKGVRVHVGEQTGPRDFNIAQLRPSPLPHASVDNIAEPRYPPTVLHTEILLPGDPRESLFDEEKCKELMGLLERGAFKLILREEAGPNPNVVPTRYVLAIKHAQTNMPPRLKARFVIGGHRDKDKNELLHDLRTVRAESIRLVIALATIFGLKLSVADWRQGYIQSKSQLLRKVFVRPKELHLNANELVQVIRPVYGLADAGEYWADTLSRHLREHLRFKQATTDLALWLKTVGSKLVALAASYVDDVLLASTPQALAEFKRISTKRFDVDINSADALSYVGLQIVTAADGTRFVSQPKQISRLKLLPTTCSFTEYRSARASLAWLIQTRPDVACAISMSARITTSSFNIACIEAYNSTVRYLRKTKDRRLQYPKLDPNSLRLACYVDAGHCNTSEGKSQLGYLLILADASNKCSILAFSSKRSRRIVRSTTAGEGLAFADGFDISYAAREDLQHALGKNIPILMLTDSQILFNIITRRRTTTERRMMVDLKSIREAYAKREIANIALIASGDNPADALTKIKANNALHKLIDDARIDHKIVQFVMEPNAPCAISSRPNSERLRDRESERCVSTICDDHFVAQQAWRKCS